MKSLHKIILFALLPLMGACSGMLDIEPHSAVSPTVVGSDDIEALRIGMYNKVQEGPTYYSYIAFDLFGGELMTSTGRPIDLINSLSNALHTFVSSQWNRLLQGAFAGEQRHVDRRGAGRQPHAEPGAGRVPLFPGVYLPLSGDPLRRRARPAAEHPGQGFARPGLDGLGTGRGGPRRGFGLPERVERRQFLLRVARRRDGPESARETLSGKKGEAKELAESLITNPNYALDDFDKIFRSKANKEVIFAFSCLTEDGSSIKISNQFYSYNHPNKGSYNYRPAGDVMTMYADNDLRKEVSITTLDNLNFVNKYPSGQTGSDPVVISRLAEMYLISAEAQGLNGGLDRLNELREKRGLDRVSPGNEADFLDAVLQERRLEFLAEGFRWYDLVRTGKATQTLGTKDYQCLMPLPSRELLYNPNLKPNNPGY